MDPYNLFITFGTMQSLVFGFILLWKSSFKDAHKYLGLCVIFLSGYLLWVIKANIGIHKYYPELRYLPLLCLWGIGPAFYTYLRFFFRKPLSSKHLKWTFFPIIVEFIYFNSRTFVFWLNNWSFNSMSPFEQKWVLNVFSIEHYIGLTSMAIYLFLSLRLLKRQEKNDLNNKILLIIICFSVIWLIWVPYTIIDSIYYDFNFPISEFYHFYILVTILTYSIGFIGFRLNSHMMIEKSFKYSQELKELSISIESKMKKEKYYLDPDLNIAIFAQNLQIHSNKISAILNNILHQSFRDYVNSYRINEFKRRLKSIHLNNHTTLSLAFECGFNSRSSFNRIFKNHVGLTPVEYLKRIEKNMSQNT